MGGIAGLTLRSHLDTAELPTEDAARVERAVRDHAGHVPAAAHPNPDAFRYEITPLDEPALAQILLDQHEVPAELQGLVESIAASGEIEGGD
jgi:hypothetical protein